MSLMRLPMRAPGVQVLQPAYRHHVAVPLIVGAGVGQIVVERSAGKITEEQSGC